MSQPLMSVPSPPGRRCGDHQEVTGPKLCASGECGTGPTHGVVLAAATAADAAQAGGSGGDIWDDAFALHHLRHGAPHPDTPEPATG
jgi:hypothetical protein